MDARHQASPRDMAAGHRLFEASIKRMAASGRAPFVGTGGSSDTSTRLDETERHLARLEVSRRGNGSRSMHVVDQLRLLEAMVSVFQVVSDLTQSVVFYSLLALILYTFYTIYRAYATPLRNVPGPFLAKFTRLWLLRAIASRKWDKINIELHRKYGPVVRIAPNEYSIDDPSAAAVIYRSRDQLLKAPRYSAWGLPAPAEANLFTTLDIDHNSKRRRQAAALYQMGALQNIEYQVDHTIATFSEKLAFFAREHKTIDLAEWLQFYAFDTIGALTFDKQIGFMEKGVDIGDLQATVHTYSRYGAIVGVFGEWHPLIFRLLQLTAPKGEVGVAYLMAFAARCVEEWNGKHSEKEKESNEESTDGGEILKTDYMSSLLAKTRRDPTFTLEDGYYHIISNVLAGGETTGIALSAALYYLIKNPQVLSKLRQELKAAKIVPGTAPSIKQAQNCPYLQAVIKEALRVFPSAGLTMPRIVPQGGLELCGYHFPEGVSVGVNSWVAHANRDVFGPDADRFRPERWLDDELRTAQMEGYFLTFGRGPRTCVGKSISLMEMNKLIPALVLGFDFHMADDGSDWTYYNDWFVRQENLMVTVVEK